MELDPSIHVDSCKVGKFTMNLLWQLGTEETLHSTFNGRCCWEWERTRATKHGIETNQLPFLFPPKPGYGAACDAHFVSLGPDS